MIVHIKNMVCQRCVLAVENLLTKLQYKNVTVSMGLVEMDQKQLSAEKKEQLQKELALLGFELIDDKKTKLIESIKNLIIHTIHHTGSIAPNFIWSEFITAKIPYEYKYLSRLFSTVQGITIEQYIIFQKTEKVKELIVYDELTLSEIAYKLGYSSVAHLSNQFKKITGMKPSDFRNIGASKRKPLDKVH